MENNNQDKTVTLDTTKPFWGRFFLVHSLVVIGTREESGEYNLAAKHMAMPLGWQNQFGFVCTAHHQTYHNVKREMAFTVNYSRPTQVVMTSLTATPRFEDESKPSLKALPTFPAGKIDGVLLQDAYLYFECEFDRTIEGFGEESLIVGRIVAAHVHEDAVRSPAKDDSDMIYQSPLLAYLSPGRMGLLKRVMLFHFTGIWMRFDI